MSFKEIKKIVKFHKEEKGGILVFMGICLIPLLLMLGLAVDSSIGLGQKRKLQMAVDAAAKAGANLASDDVSAITAQAQKIFNANITNMMNVTGPFVSVDTVNDVVTVSASVVVQNTFMKLANLNTNTYNATSSVPLNMGPASEIAIVYELSTRYAGTNFHENVCNSLINFVNSLPDNIMVSITPIATEFQLDTNNTVSSNLFNHLSSTTNDESVNPAFFPLSNKLAWNLPNYNLVTNLFYTAGGEYATYPTDPGVLISNPSPGMCTIPTPNYPSCSTIMWPNKCPGTNNISCSQVYSYISNAVYPILPLTANKSLLVNYINGLKAFTPRSGGFFPSLISWGWRTIDPAWKDFWMINANAKNTVRRNGVHPNAYGTKQKSMILIVYGGAYWDSFPNDANSYYINPCGDATKVVKGLNHWWLTSYGMVPIPTDYQAKANDITCENRWYKTMDRGLGLALSDSTNYNGTLNTTSFQSAILSEVKSKFLRICSNIQAKGIDVYVLTAGDLSEVSPCCNTYSNSSGNAYASSNSPTGIGAGLNSFRSKILAKLS
ncbi:MAG: hypothetical protein FJX71_06400 [Alphaproteobacteria bacterium]|nr:hypothetical protein [Alphaproteobacteria bacterium]